MRHLPPIPLPEEAKKKHTEPFVVEGVMWAANACKRCEKWIPPWKAGVPMEVVDEYCWGHDDD